MNILRHACLCDAGQTIVASRRRSAKGEKPLEKQCVWPLLQRAWFVLACSSDPFVHHGLSDVPPNVIRKRLCGVTAGGAVPSIPRPLGVGNDTDLGRDRQGDRLLHRRSGRDRLFTEKSHTYDACYGIVCRVIFLRWYFSCHFTLSILFQFSLIIISDRSTSSDNINPQNRLNRFHLASKRNKNPKSKTILAYSRQLKNVGYWKKSWKQKK